MENKSSIAPFIVKPLRINNYTHLITLLKLKQKKYSEYVHEPVNHSFSNCLSSNEINLNLDEVLEGFLHEKLKEKMDEYEKNVNFEFLKSIDVKIKELKIENDMKIHGLKIGNIAEVEGLLFQKPSAFTFKDELLYDLYEFILNKKNSSDFLNYSYMKFIKKHFNEEKLKELNVKNQIREFVKLKFNKDEYNIEVYENRYLWAEIFICFRVGRIDLIREIMEEYEIFFEFMSQKFKTAFLGFLEGKKGAFYLSSSIKDDKFKKFFIDLIDDKIKSDGLVINTVEDYLWMKLVSNREIKSDIEQFENNRVKFMIALLSGKHKKAIDILLKSEFGIVSKFFLLKELCFEQSFEQPVVNTFDKSNKVQRGAELKSKVIDECSSSNSSYSLISSDMPHTSMNTLFLNFLFTLISKLTKKEYKVKLVEMLKNHADYYNVIPAYIIKYQLFDILGKSLISSGDVEFALDDTIAHRVLKMLRECGDIQNLIKLGYLMDDVTMIQLLSQAIEETILVDGSIDCNIIEKYISKKSLKDTEKLINLYNFFKFDKSPCVGTLRQTVMFSKGINLSDYKFVIEKVFSKAVEIVKNESDKLMASALFILCGTLGLNEECTNKVSKDLVMLI